MPQERLTERIISYMSSRRYRPQKVRALARTLGIADEEYGDFHDAVKALMHSGRVVMGSASALLLPEPTGAIVGKFRLNQRGFGFVIPDVPNAHGDLYVPAEATAGAITGDTVRAVVTRRGKRDGRMMYEGRIENVIQRGHSRFVGELVREGGRWFVVPDGNVLHVPIFVDDVSAKGARAGDQVVLEITAYPKPMHDARGVIVEVLGKRGDPGVDTKSIIRQYGLPEAFDERVVAEARAVSAEFDPQRAAHGREDLRGRVTVTIDPVNARDFDDAITLEESATADPRHDGQFELGVHIADVSHFVRPGTALDDAARERANSVYFPQHVVPMLPEVLSNGVCSLQEGQPRLTKSAFIAYDREGRVLRTRFANSLIASTKRLTYEEATQILEGKVGGYPKPVAQLLRRMDLLARIIRQRRIREGMLVLELPEVELVFDELARVTGVVPEDMSFSHTIIEMFMVEANEAVARLFVKLGVPHLRRVHEEPDDATLEGLTRFLKAIGNKPPKRIDRAWLQGLLAEVKGAPASFAINLAVLRSMQRAEYRPDLIGHYALASEDYLHFTSPIRRYPDLVDHRLLEAYLAGKFEHKKKSRGDTPTFEELHEMGVHCSANERRAEAAERELKLVKILQLLESRVGEQFDGVVTGVAQFGVFVQLREYLVDGLLRYADLADDWWNVDAEGGFVIGERTGRRIAIGQQLRVALSRIDVPNRTLDLALVAEGQAGRARPPSQRTDQPRAGRKRGARPGRRNGRSPTAQRASRGRARRR
ncbi:MAG TPA: ribonuclease R [Phycisphaerae bacterium]